MHANGAPSKRTTDTPAHSAHLRPRPHGRFSIRALTATIACVLAVASSAHGDPSPAAIALALHLAPNTRVTATRTSTHLVSYDMNHTLMSLLGSRAAPTTLVDARTATIDVGADGVHVAIDDLSLRHYGGDAPKDASQVTRHEKYAGSIAPDGVRTPPLDHLSDAGDGALDQLPHDPIAVGASWTFTRPVLLDRSLAQATMTYTDTLKSVDVRAGHTIATIAVSATGMAEPASDLAAKGFKPSTFTLTGTAEFDVTAGLPGTQSYTGRVEWTAHPLFTRIGLIFDDTFAATPWTAAAGHP